MHWRYQHLSGTGTTQVTPANNKASLMTVNVNTAAAGSTITIRDGDGTGAVMGVIDGGTIASKGYGVLLPNGICAVVAGGSPDVTIGYV